MIENNCRKCGVSLDDTNWYPSCKNFPNRICTNCCKIQTEKWRKIHHTDESYKESKKISDKKYSEKNKEKKSKGDKEYRKKNKEKYNKYNKDYYKINKKEISSKRKEWRKTPEGKISTAKERHKRRRGLGFIPLNEKFNESEPHHIDNDNVIYVPKEWNQMIPHNVWTGKNMDIVNSYAYFFLVQQNIEELNNLFKI